MQEAFRVWLRALGYEWRVCVDGLESARWLLRRLSEAFVFQSCEGIHQESGAPSCKESASSLCTFKVPYQSFSHSAFVKLLAAVPEVRLMSDLGSPTGRPGASSSAESNSRR